jgi:hypothetical protein
MNAADLLRKMAKKEPEKKSKSTTPVIMLPSSDTLIKAFESWIRSKHAEKQAETARNQQEEILLPQVEKVRSDYCLTKGKFESAIKVCIDAKEFKKGLSKDEAEQYADTYTLTFVVQNKYSDIKLTAEEALKSLVAQVFELKDEAKIEAEFKRLFVLASSIEISEEGMRRIDEILPCLIKAVGGEEKFNKLFTITQKYHPTDIFHESRILDSKVKKLAEKAINDELIKPCKPSFRE